MLILPCHLQRVTPNRALSSSVIQHNFSLFPIYQTLYPVNAVFEIGQGKTVALIPI